MKNFTLSKKRAHWVQSHKPQVMEGLPLKYNAGIRAKYKRDLLKLITYMERKTKREIEKLFKSQAAKEFKQQEMKLAQDANIASQSRVLLNKLIKQFDYLFNLKTPKLVNWMVNETDKVSAYNLKESLKKLSGGLTIDTKIMPAALKTIIKASVNENVALIKSIQQDYLSRVKKTVTRSIINGDGLDTLIPALEKYDGITERHARNMATDQTRKVYNSMNAKRMQKVGIQRFKWLHSGGGQRPRLSHVEMNGNIYSFDNLPQINKDNPKEPPEFGIPGQAINCGCTMQPVLEFAESNND